MNESVEVNPEFIRLTFTDYLDEASFTQAFSITPIPSGQRRLSWRGRSVTVRFDDEWRDSTTYVITLDTRLRSWRGVGLLRPIIVAFATGPVIDQGHLSGRAVEPLRGGAAEGLSVFALDSQDLEAEPSYVTSTGEDGQFDLSYVREAEYFVIVLDDANRNRRPDPTERFAVPPQPWIRASADTTAPRAAWVIGRLDTLAPAIDRVRAMSAVRLSVRFTEAIMMSQRRADQWTLADSATGVARNVQQVYGRLNDPLMLFLLTDSLDDRTWSLSPDVTLTDSTGNGVAIERAFFTGRVREDTTRVRFLGFLPEAPAAEIPLSPRDYPSLEFNQPVADSTIARMVQVSDSLGQDIPFSTSTMSGSVYRLTIDHGDYARVTVHLPKADISQGYRRLTARDLGSLSGVAVPGGTQIMVELFPEHGNRPYAQTRADDAGMFLFDQLPAESFMIRAFHDRNGNGRWDAGAISPFVAAEPIAWLSEPLSVRPRWDTAAADTLRLIPPDSPYYRN